MAGSSLVEPGQDEIGAAIFLALLPQKFPRTALRLSGNLPGSSFHGSSSQPITAQRLGHNRAHGIPPPSAANTPPHRRRGSRRAGGSRSCRLAGRQAQARQEQLAMLGVPQVADVRYYDRGNGSQPRYDLSCVVELAHMGVAGGEKAIRHREAWILVDREDQFRHGLIEAPT